MKFGQFQITRQHKRALLQVVVLQMPNVPIYIFENTVNDSRFPPLVEMETNLIGLK